MSCQVAKCRFPTTHITSYHKCGNCNGYGHGRVECYKKPQADSLDKFFLSPPHNEPSETIQDDYSLINELHNKPKIPLPPAMHCTITGCSVPSTHSTSAHQKDFDQYATLNGPDQYSIRRIRAEGLQKVTAAVQGRPGCYAKIYWGMGNMIYARNINGNVSTTISDGDISTYIAGLTEIKVRAHGKQN